MLGAHKEVFQKVGDCMFHHPHLLKKFCDKISDAAEAGKKRSDQRKYSHMYLPVRAFIEVFENANSYTTLEEHEFANAVENYIRTIRYWEGKIIPIAYKRFHAFFAWMIVYHPRHAENFHCLLKKEHKTAQKNAHEGAEIRKVILPEFSELEFNDKRPLPPPSMLVEEIKIKKLREKALKKRPQHYESKRPSLTSVEVAFPQTAEQVDQRVTGLRQRFFGRKAEFKCLDDFLENNDNGLLVISAPAGSGKSALLANWLNHRSDLENNIAYHFISGQDPLTNGPKDILDNLLRQIRTHLGKKEINTQSYKVGALRASIFNELTETPKDNNRLIIILDGLDEAKSLFEPFIEEARLANNIFVIVSARQDAEVVPACLRRWKQRIDNGLHGETLTLSGLGTKSVTKWLKDVIGNLDNAESKSLAHAVRDTTGGLPLFLSYVFDDLQTALPTLTTKEERLNLIHKMPAPFTKYIGRQLNMLAEAEGKLWSQKTQLLFAVLSRTLGPIHKDDLRAALGTKCPTLESLDHRVMRWLSVRQGNYSFTHPMLARAFAQVVGLDEDEINDGIPEIGKASLGAEDTLIDWMEKAWKPRKDRRGVCRGAAYALEWLPEHLVRTGKQGEREAALLIADPAFLDEWLQDPDCAAVRLARNCDLWASLPFEARKFDGAREWTAFWAENETSLRLAAKYLHPEPRPFANVVRNCLGDSLIGGSGKTPNHNALIPHTPVDRGLVRSISDAHKGCILGLLSTFEGDFVSWGDDNAIRFWDAQGSSIKGGETKAHMQARVHLPSLFTGVKGVLPISDGNYISWGDDGAVYFKNRDGTIRSGGDSNAHPDVLFFDKGVLPTLDGHYISWDDYGTIHHWKEDGNKKPDIEKARWRQKLRGVLPIKNGGYVKWGSHAHINFIFGDGTAKTHLSGEEMLMGGFIPNGDQGYLSWADNGSIYFWDTQGNCVNQISDAHSPKKGAINGVLPLSSKSCVSWGVDGAIRFWDEKGNATNGGSINAHSNISSGFRQHGVGGVLEAQQGGFVSWGRDDGAIRFWDKEGFPVKGGVPNAHLGGVVGVSLTLNGYVSWGVDGAIRFWNSQLNSEEGWDPKLYERKNYNAQIVDALEKESMEVAVIALHHWGQENELQDAEVVTHEGRQSVRGVLPINGGGFLDWYGEGKIYFRDAQGKINGSGGVIAHDGKVNGVLETQQGGFISWGEGGAIRFWNEKGVCTKGGSLAAHSRWVTVVLPIRSGGYISGGGDGVIRFWDSEGTPKEEGVFIAHHGAVRNIVSIDNDRFVSWAADSSLRLWNANGETASFGGSIVHRRGIKGVLATKDSRLICWDGNGSISFWDIEVQPTLIDIHKAHNITFGVAGTVSIDKDRFVSWDKNGTIHLWNQEGFLENTIVEAHTHVKGVQSGKNGEFISWGDDGTIRFWNLYGDPIESGVLGLHSSSICGVHLISIESYISWDFDGSVFFWNRNDLSKINGTRNIHGSKVDKVVLAPNGDYFSWSFNGVVCFWSHIGEPLGTFIVPGGARYVEFIDDKLVVVGKNFWVYSCKNGLPWNEHGSRR